jgi:hypothetical protein
MSRKPLDFPPLSCLSDSDELGDDESDHLRRWHGFNKYFGSEERDRGTRVCQGLLGKCVPRIDARQIKEFWMAEGRGSEAGEVKRQAVISGE